MSTYFSQPQDPNRMQKAPGRRLAQVANPYQQQPGEDKNVEQQALGQALGVRDMESDRGAFVARQKKMASMQGPMGQQPQIDQMPQLPGQSGQIQISQGMMGTPHTAGPGPGPQPPAPPPGRVEWNTDGYARPNHTASNFGQAPAGWDPRKWADPNHQTPKYVVGRILQESGDLRDPDRREQALDNIRDAYGPENFRFNGKDKISIDGGRTFVDIFGGAGAGVYSPAWQDESAQGGAPQGTMGGFQGSSNLMALQQALQGGGARSATPAAMPPMSAPAPAGGAAPTRVDHRDPSWATRGVDFNKLQPGQTINGQTFTHDGQGWLVSSGGAPAQVQAPGLQPAAQGAIDPSIYQPGALPTGQQGAYNPYKFDRVDPGSTEFAQFKGPDQGGIESQQQSILQQILANPLTLNNTAVSQLKERGKEEALAMEKQLGDRLSQNAASRGISGGGFENANARRLGESTMQSILRGNRDIDLAKVAQDRDDQLGALGAADSVLGNQMSRAGEGFRNTLLGQQAKSDSDFRNAALDFDQQEAEAQEGRFGFQAGMDRDRFALDRAVAGEGFKQAGADSWARKNRFDLDSELGRADVDIRNRGLDIQDFLGRGGLDVDNRRISEGGRQFDLSHDLAMQELVERMRQFNGNLGLGYNELNQRGQSDLMKTILGMY